MRFRGTPALAVLVTTGAILNGQSEQLHVVVPRDAIRSIDQPTFEPASKVKSLDDREPVLGIVGVEAQRAYSTWQLDRHEIVNDVFEGKPISVTW